MFFQNALAIYALDPEFLKLLKVSGVNELVLPVESGSERVLAGRNAETFATQQNP